MSALNNFQSIQRVSASFLFAFQNFDFSKDSKYEVLSNGLIT